MIVFDVRAEEEWGMATSWARCPGIVVSLREQTGIESGSSISPLLLRLGPPHPSRDHPQLSALAQEERRRAHPRPRRTSAASRAAESRLAATRAAGVPGDGRDPRPRSAAAGSAGGGGPA
jgi:hypothetical protein